MSFSIVLAFILLIGTVSAKCTEHRTFDNGKVSNWMVDQDDLAVGKLTCDKKFVVEDSDVVLCQDNVWNDAKCINDPNGDDKKVSFKNQVYEFHNVKLTDSTKTYPLINKNTSYVLTTDYIVSKNTPTVRVRVGLVGTAINPVLVTVQQSTESVGFELPMRIEGKGGKELAPLQDHTVELCPLSLEQDDDGKDIPLPQTVRVTIDGNEPADKKKKLSVQVDFKAAAHIDIKAGEPTSRYNMDDRQSLVYRYRWPKDDSVDEVDILIYHPGKEGKQEEGKGADVCAKVSLRSGKCPLEEMGVSDLTFTRQAFITVSKHDKNLKNVKDGILIVMDVFPDDYNCRSSPSATESLGRTKSVQVLVTERKHEPKYDFLALPIVTVLVIFAITAAVHILIFGPQKKKLELLLDGEDSSLIDADEEKEEEEEATFFRNPPPPYEVSPTAAAAEISAKQVDLGETEEGVRNEEAEEEIPSETAPEDSPSAPNTSFTTSTTSTLASLLSKVKRNEHIVHLQEAIGHNSIPVLIFLTQIPPIIQDIQGNLKSYSLSGDLDSCYTNSRCAVPANISNYRVPDISRVVSNMPYAATALCFYLLVVQKSKIMRPVNLSGRGVSHDYGLFTALAVITLLVGLSSSMYHVCANQTTSRVDMFFIEILLGYFSLCLYQARNPNITSVLFAPAILITVMTACEQVFGLGWFTWTVIAVTHVLCTLFVGIQLFLIGRFTMSPLQLWQERDRVCREIKESKKKPAYKWRGGTFAIGLLCTIILAITGVKGLWRDHSMYNVVAIVIDISLYLCYYFINKLAIRKEKVMRSTVVVLAAAAIMWLLSSMIFLFTRSIDTSVSPAESRALNRECMLGPIDSHDMWHCLSALSMFLTEILLLNLDDDQIDVKTVDIYF